MKLCYSKVIYAFVLIINTIFVNSVIANYNLNRNVEVYDLPVKSDLPVYLASLQRIVDFFNRHLNDVDINVMFGLFLVNVNLKRSSKSHKGITEPLKRYLSEIIYENDKVLNYFKFKVETDVNPHDVNVKKIITLFSNETAWFKTLPRIASPPLHNVGPRRNIPILTGDPFSWKKYKTNVDNFEKWVPNPKLSDYCMASLAESGLSKTDAFFTCRVPEKCVQMLINGTDFGYSLTHRLLFLLNAQHGHGCSIFSQNMDQLLINKFCSMAYIEAEYIITHNYEIVDLILEQVCLCALYGHVEFLHRFWLTNILRFQTEHGCFGEYLPRTRYVERLEQNVWKLSKVDHDLLGGECNGHVTAGAAATLSVSVRFILENYN